MDKNAEYAVRNIISLVNVCPDVKFFATKSMLEKIENYLESNQQRMGYKKALMKTSERWMPVPRGLVNVLTNLAFKDPVLRKSSFQATRTSVHHLITLKKKNREEHKALLEIVKNLKIDNDLLEKLNIPERERKILANNREELNQALRELRKLLECVVKNL